MTQRLDDLEPQTASAREFWLGYGCSDRRDDVITAYRSGLADSQLNGVLRVRGTVDQAIAAAAQSLGDLPSMWWAGPDSDPGLAAALMARGAVELERDPIMAIRLDEVPMADGQRGLIIDEVASDDGLAEWVRGYAPSFGFPPELVPALVAMEAARPDPPGSLVRLTARIDGKLAGTGALLDRHGVAGVYVVTTPAEFRRRGIATALTAAALAIGRERGRTIGTLQATPEGEPVYQRMGFTTVAEYRFLRFPSGAAG
ncbi:MAG TPA: GNAT family N-acetyltransferase [Streptosporangiaceae bacterium]|jgi:ribosomal protein S18 acetylase RimI-like enzyme